MGMQLVHVGQWRIGGGRCHVAPNGKRRMLQRLEKEFVSVLLSMTDTLQFNEIQKTQCAFGILHCVDVVPT